MGVVQRLLELVVDARNADLAAEDAAAAAASAGGWSAAGRGGRRAADGGGGGRWTAPAGAGTDATFLRAAVEHARLADALRPYNEKVAARAGGGRGGRANAAGPDGDAVDEGNPYARIFRDYMAGVPRGPLDAVLASEARLWGMMRDAGARLVGPPGPPEAEPDDPTAAAGAALVSATLRRRRVAEEEELLRLALHAERRHRAPILRLGLAAQVELEAAGCTLWSADARDALWGVLTRRPQRASLAAVRQALWETEGPAVAAAVDHLFRDPTDAAAHLPDPPVGPAGGGGGGGGYAVTAVHADVARQYAELSAVRLKAPVKHAAGSVELVVAAAAEGRPDAAAAAADAAAAAEAAVLAAAQDVLDAKTRAVAEREAGALGMIGVASAMRALYAEGLTESTG